jgi:hypothetical protein
MRPTLSCDTTYASGDQDPSDTTIERFNSLLGARSFDFGPTNIYGPISRSQHQHAELAAQLGPEGPLAVDARVTRVFLAQARDQWVGSGWSDPTGKSGARSQADRGQLHVDCDPE